MAHDPHAAGANQLGRDLEATANSPAWIRGGHPDARDYTVDWRIDVAAVTPEDAARAALAAQRRRGSTAGVFDVTDGSSRWRVDLTHGITAPLAAGPPEPGGLLHVFTLRVPAEAVTGSPPGWGTALIGQIRRLMADAGIGDYELALSTIGRGTVEFGGFEDAEDV
jgi:hypothetical protein